MAELESVAVDGEGVLARILGEIADVAQLKRSASLWLGSSGCRLRKLSFGCSMSFWLSRESMKGCARCRAEAMRVLGGVGLPTQGR